MQSMDYVQRIFAVCKRYSSQLTCTTNGTHWELIELCLKNNIQPSVSLNRERTHYLKTINTLWKRDCSQVNLLTVCLPSVLRQGAQSWLDFVESFHVKSLTLLQYYPAELSKRKYEVTDEQYEDFMIELIQAYRQKGYSYTLTNAYDKPSGCPITTSIFITPDGKFANTEYDDNGLERFVIFDTLDAFYASIAGTYVRSKCLSCRLPCMAEHYRLVNGKCSGLPKLSMIMLSDVSKNGGAEKTINTAHYHKV